MLNVTANLRLQEAQKKIQQQIAQKQQVVAQAAVELAQALCPVGTAPHKDGSPHMRDTIGWLTLPDGSIVLFCKAPYAADVEFGHHTRSGSSVAARPFFTPAQEFMRHEMMNTLRGLLG